jgi:hypothetical protein
MRAGRWWLIIKQLGARLLRAPAACRRLSSIQNEIDHSKLPKIRFLNSPLFC